MSIVSLRRNFEGKEVLCNLLIKGPMNVVTGTNIPTFFFCFGVEDSTETNLT